MELQETYDELDNIVRKLDSLIDEITSKDYIEQFEYIKYQAEKEKDDIEPLLQEQYASEEQELQAEYIRSVL